MTSDADKLTARHPALVHSEGLKVVSHVQREEGEWVRHTLMLQDYDVPFIFRRRGRYKPLVGARVNLTYYPQQEEIAGVVFEQMKVVRIKRA